MESLRIWLWTYPLSDLLVSLVVPSEKVSSMLISEVDNGAPGPVELLEMDAEDILMELVEALRKSLTSSPPEQGLRFAYDPEVTRNSSDIQVEYISVGDNESADDDEAGSLVSLENVADPESNVPIQVVAPGIVADLTPEAAPTEDVILGAGRLMDQTLEADGKKIVAPLHLSGHFDFRPDFEWVMGPQLATLVIDDAVPEASDGRDYLDHHYGW